jgi:hypothetical protein
MENSASYPRFPRSQCLGKQFVVEKGAYIGSNVIISNKNIFK